MYLENDVSQISPSIYKLISQDHYYDNENLLTEDNLKNLSQFSETIEEPNVCGEFNSEEHYLKTLRLVLASTYETRNRVLFFLNQVLPLLPEKKSLLDVGPGDASLTKYLAKYFKHITATDLNNHVLNNLEKHLPNEIDYVKKVGCVRNLKFNSNYYDLVVLSHILYYINTNTWLEVINSTYKSLKENGLLVIVLGGDELGKGDLIRDFGGKTLAIDQLASSCQNIYGHINVSLSASTESFVSCSRQAMLHIASFMLGDANIKANKEDLLKYINKKFRRSEGHYEMTTRQKYILIRKANHHGNRLAFLEIIY